MGGKENHRCISPRQLKKGECKSSNKIIKLERLFKQLSPTPCWEHNESINLFCLCIFLNLRSVCLLMQVAMPCVLFAASPSELRLKGGTNAEMAPQIDYTLMVSRSSCT